MLRLWCAKEAVDTLMPLSLDSRVISGMARVVDVMTGFVYCDHLQVRRGGREGIVGRGGGRGGDWSEL